MATPTTLPSTFSAGAVLTAAQMNNLRGAFRVLQVVNATTTAGATNNTNTYADTNLTATITPTSTSSKILVCVRQSGLYKFTNDQSGVWIRLMRGASEIALVAGNYGYTATTTIIIIGNAAIDYLDSPATTSATTYKTQFRNQANAAGVTVQQDGAMSTLTLMEISA